MKIVGRVVMADAESDTAARDIAKTMWGHVLQLFSSSASLKRAVVSTDQKNLYLSLSHLPEFSAFKDDHLFLYLTRKAPKSKKNKWAGVFGVRPGTNDVVIKLAALPARKNLTGMEWEDIQELLKPAASTFLHEFIHFLDSKRWKKGGPIGMLKSVPVTTKNAKGVNDSNRSAYYNNPVEYNAHAQQALDEIEDILDKYAHDTKLAHVIDGGQGLKRAWFDGMVKQHRLTEVWEPKWIKKFFKRFYLMVDAKMDKWKKEFNL